MKKSPKYPSKNLFEAKDYIISLYDNHGDQVPLDYSGIAEHGNVPLREAPYFASSTIQYGWSNPVRGTGYVPVGSICKAFKNPHEGEVESLYLEAFKRPELYKDLINYFQNKSLQEKAIITYLSREKDFSDKGAAICAAVFVANAKGLGLVNADNIFNIDAPVVLAPVEKTKRIRADKKDKATKDGQNGVGTKKSSDSREEKKPHVSSVDSATSTGTNTGQQNKTIIVFIKGHEYNWPVPANMSQTDWDQVVKQIQNIKTWAK